MCASFRAAPSKAGMCASFRAALLLLYLLDLYHRDFSTGCGCGNTKRCLPYVVGERIEIRAGSVADGFQLPVLVPNIRLREVFLLRFCQLPPVAGQLAGKLLRYILAIRRAVSNISSSDAASFCDRNSHISTCCCSVFSIMNDAAAAPVLALERVKKPFKISSISVSAILSTLQ